MTDPLTTAIRELDESDVKILLETYKHLAVEADTGARRAFFLAVAAHLNAEQRRRAEVLIDFAVALDGDSSGALVDEPLEDYIDRERANLREGPTT